MDNFQEHPGYYEEPSELEVKYKKLQAELEQAKKEIGYQQAKINIRDSHLRERCEKVRQLRKAVGLLNSMVLCGEKHSDESRKIVKHALKG